MIFRQEKFDNFTVSSNQFSFECIKKYISVYINSVWETTMDMTNFSISLDSGLQKLLKIEKKNIHAYLLKILKFTN